MKHSKSLHRAMTIFVFAILVVSALMTGVLVFLLRIFLPEHYAHFLLRPFLSIGLSLAVSAAIGSVLSLFFTKHFMKPLSELMAATKAVAAGDYSVRVYTNKMLVDFEEYHSPVNEFEDFVESFNKMAESLGSVEMLRSDFINTISHEFKTPVVSIRGFAKLLQNPDLTEEQRKLYTDTIIQQSLLLSTMSSNILLLSQYENAQSIPDKETYSLDEQLRNVISLQSKDWLDKNITLEGQLDSVTYFGNPDIMAHVWSNLLSNAIKFTPENGSIHISLSRAGDSAIVRFRDSGIGMDSETLSHIYEKFYQADSSRRSTGNGLGLAIASRIVTLCRGTIEVSSAPGDGTEFIVTLPLEKAPEKA